MRLFEKTKEAKVARIPMSHRVRPDLHAWAKDAGSEAVEGALEIVRELELTEGARLRAEVAATGLSMPLVVVALVQRGLYGGKKGKR